MINLLSKSVETFKHRFRGGVRAEMRITVDAGQVREFSVEWDPAIPRGKKLLKIFPEYQAWRTANFAAVARKFGFGKMLVIDTTREGAVKMSIATPDGKSVEV